MLIGQKLRDIRETKNLSQDDIERASGLVRPYAQSSFFAAIRAAGSDCTETAVQPGRRTYWLAVIMPNKPLA